MDMKSVLKTSVAAAALFAVATPASAQEKTDNVTMMQKGVTVALYGQINKSVQWASDGEGGDRIAITDNDTSSTRWGLVIGAPINPNFSFGARLEVEMQSNDSNNLTLNSGGGDNNFGQSNFCERIAEVSLNHKQFGTVTLGQGPTASDGTAEVDLSGTTVVALSAASSWATNLGAVRFTQDTAGHVLSGVQINSAFSGLDGLSRQDRIRYDTPTIMGFQLSGSFISGGAADVALRYGQKFGAFQVAAAAAYWNQNSVSTTIDDGWDASAAVLHDSGLNAMIAGGKQNMKSGSGRPDPDFIFGKIGYIAKIFGVGPTSFAVDYGEADDFAQAAGVAVTQSDGTSVGVTAVQMFSATGTEAYLSWRRWTFDSAGTNYNDVNTVIGGVRVKF